MSIVGFEDVRPYQALKKHIYRFHRNLLDVPEELVEATSTTMYGDDDPDVEVATPKSLPTLQAAKFILNTCDGKKITQTATDGIVNDVKVVLQNTVDVMEQAVMTKLR